MAGVIAALLLCRLLVAQSPLRSDPSPWDQQDGVAGISRLYIESVTLR